MHFAAGIVERNGKTVRALVYESRRSHEEFAITDGGLYLFPNSYIWKDVYDVEGEEDAAEVEEMLRNIYGTS